MRCSSYFFIDCIESVQNILGYFIILVLTNYLWVLQDPIETEKSFARRILAIVVPFTLFSSFLHRQYCAYMQHNRKKRKRKEKLIQLSVLSLLFLYLFY